MANRNKSKPLTDEDGEVRVLTKADLVKFIPFSALPEAEQKMLLALRRSGPRKVPTKLPRTSRG